MIGEKDLLDEARARAARGAAFLDERVPDWASRINTAMLRMASNCQCVLGQLFQEYCCIGFWELRLNQEGQRNELGFSLGLFDTPGLTYNMLDQAWGEEIAKRVPSLRPPEPVCAPQAQEEALVCA